MYNTNNLYLSEEEKIYKKKKKNVVRTIFYIWVYLNFGTLFRVKRIFVVSFTNVTQLREIYYYESFQNKINAV